MIPSLALGEIVEIRQANYRHGERLCSAAPSRSFAPATLPVAADEATFGLSEVNWAILPGGIVSWNVAQLMSFRDAMYYACTGETFNGKPCANFSVAASAPRAARKNSPAHDAPVAVEGLARAGVIHRIAKAHQLGHVPAHDAAGQNRPVDFRKTEGRFIGRDGKVGRRKAA